MCGAGSALMLVLYFLLLVFAAGQGSQAQGVGCQRCA